MKSINLKLSVLMLLFGALFLLQCERDRGTQQQSSQQLDETNRGHAAEETDYQRHNEGRGGDELTATGAGHVVDIADNREQLIENMQELLSELVDELEQSTGTDRDTERRTDSYTESIEQIQNNQQELTEVINEAEKANDQNWEDIREDVQETYVRIAVDHNERIRPDGAHGGRGF